MNTVFHKLHAENQKRVTAQKFRIYFFVGFSFQEVATKPQKWKIFGVRKKNAEIKNNIKAIQECRKNVENSKFFIEN